MCMNKGPDGSQQGGVPPEAMKMMGQGDAPPALQQLADAQKGATTQGKPAQKKKGK